MTHTFFERVTHTFARPLFGRKKPKVPTANAEVSLQIPQAEYALTGIYTANGGNRDLVKAMGEAARDTLNGLIQVVARGDDEAKVSNTTTVVTSYGHTGGQLWVRLGGTTGGQGGSSGGTLVNVTSADEAVDKGVLWALPQTQIIGGDMFLKRALYNMVRYPAQVTSVANGNKQAPFPLIA